MLDSVIRRLWTPEKAVVEGSAIPQQAKSTLLDPWRKQVGVALLLTSFAFLVYNANLRLVSAGDNYPTRYLPFVILKHRTLRLDPIADIVGQGHQYPYWCVERDGRTYSRYPVTVAVLVAPLYLPAVAYLDRYGWTDDRLDRTARIMEKLTASLIAGLSVGLMYLLLVRRTTCKWPVLLTIAFAFGTNTWMISGQALWQHGIAELLLVLALFLVLGECTAARALALGFSLALIVAIRPPDALLAAAPGVIALRWSGRRIGLLLLGVTVPLVLLVAYNYRVALHPVGGYAMPWNSKSGLAAFRYSLVEGVAGLLFSPARGLFVFTPFLLFLPVGLYATLRQPRVRVLALLGLGAMAAQIALYARLDWRAGCAWGPRWLTDMLPLLVWMLAAGLSNLPRIGFAVFVVTVCLSIGIQTVGAFQYNGASELVIQQYDGDPNSEPLLWDFRHAPFVAELRHAAPPGELLLEALGSIDRVRVDGTLAEETPAGPEVEIEGWTLTNRQTPVAVEVSLIPPVPTRWKRKRSYPMAGTTAFFERSDVTHTMQGKGPSGWRVVLKTDGLTPGPYRIEVRALGRKDGEGRRVISRPFRILPDGLEAWSQVVANRLRNRQHADGFWLTAHTKSPRFDRPKHELNLFVTAIIGEALEPVAGAAGLEDNLERVRSHIRSQIEAGGLVRYHGRPDSPTVPSLGPVITPDADDTALAWRIAGPKGDTRRASALQVLKSYRTSEGLYRTWLAPQEEYVSIDPGKDPNPPDVGIQMHVLMFLHQVDPAAARSLYLSLRSAIEEDRIWVYYKLTPLVPLWRAADLHNLGYPVNVPPNRLRTAAPGQEIWVEACRQLASYSTEGASRPAPAETRRLLETLASKDFAAIRENPPMLFHNDLTAKCSRYYWSEDFGYALWLRLYQEMVRSAPRCEISGAK